MRRKRQGDKEKPKRDFAALGITDQDTLDRFMRNHGKRLHVVSEEFRTELVQHAVKLGLRLKS